MLNNNSFSYIPHLKKAYIDPIRTVTVIDDEYPTMEDLVNKNAQQYTDDDLERLREIINVSRDSSYNWMLDVYNGRESTVDKDLISNRLHHSDLLILDYHLDGHESGYCSTSIDIIKKLANDRNHNIVAVHTKGYTGDKGSVQDVLIDVVVSLSKKPLPLTISEKAFTRVQVQIDDWNIESDKIRDKLLGSISVIDILYLLHKLNFSEVFENELSKPYLSVFRALYSEKPNEIALDENLLFKWICREKLLPHATNFSSEEANFLDWGYSDGINWVRTEDLFLTVLGKKSTPIHEITNKILQAMEYSRPHPHKLILSKLINEIEKSGSSASSKIINKKFLQAAWLKDLTNSNMNNEAIKTTAWATITKLLEELSYEIKQEVGDFTIDLAKDLRKMQSPLAHFIDEKTLSNEVEQIKHANCFSCSRVISTHHLVTGHVIKIDKTYWICLTPMCDLVPGQKSTNTYMPVTLVQMNDARDALAKTLDNMRDTLKVNPSQADDLNDDEKSRTIINYSTENNLLFIKTLDKEDDITILSFTIGLDGKSNPKSKEFYVENQGVFDIDERKITLRSTEFSHENGELFVKPQIAEVVAELRYEYALNLSARLGVYKTRIGLDFIK